MPAIASNVRVSVQFLKAAVYAGEDVECTITFTNAVRHRENEKSAQRPQHTNRLPSDSKLRKQSTIAVAARPSLPRNAHSVPHHPPRAGHRPTLSLNTITQIQNPIRGQDGIAESSSGSFRPKHGKSLSIVSIGTDVSGYGDQTRLMNEDNKPARKGHSRASSIQSGLRRGMSSPLMGTIGISEGRSPDTSTDQSSSHQATRRPSQEPTSRSSGLRRSPGGLMQEFKFPAVSEDRTDADIHPDSALSPTAGPVLRQHRGPRAVEEPFLQPDTSLNPIARIISSSSAAGTPRSSMEFYPMSNNSTETLASEYIAPKSFLKFGDLGRQSPRPMLSRATSSGPETLMMGFAQLTGSFTLDGSLIDQAPFEEVKRKGMAGGNNSGGVVGVERPKRESGLFGGLGWSAIGGSIGGLLGGGDSSNNVKEIRGIILSRTIPLITTPSSILFVDLKLSPGESRSYQYSFTLPRGLPPSHKGRAMKISYNLTIGVQRPGSMRDQQVKSIEIPFRVFSGINARGEPLGHDLMNPYILLRDTARTKSISSRRSIAKVDEESDLPEFLDYVDALLSVPAVDTTAFLSPTATMPPALRRKSSFNVEEPRNMKEAIDFAILRLHHSGLRNDALTNRFHIARSGLRVATLLLPRPSYRLGETVTLLIDFHDSKTNRPPDIPTYAVQIALETSEKVDTALAVRSTQSIYRYTRKVHAYSSMSAISSSRLSFALSIPSTATPDFITSGISLEWRLRVEFITPRSEIFSYANDGADGSDGTESKVATSQPIDMQLLDSVGSDDQGTLLQGLERLKVETFEVGVPLRVYGAPAAGGKGEGTGDVENLPI